MTFSRRVESTAVSSLDTAYEASSRTADTFAAAALSLADAPLAPLHVPRLVLLLLLLLRCHRRKRSDAARSTRLQRHAQTRHLVRMGPRQLAGAGATAAERGHHRPVRATVDFGGTLPRGRCIGHAGRTYPRGASLLFNLPVSLSRCDGLDPLRTGSPRLSMPHQLHPEPLAVLDKVSTTGRTGWGRRVTLENTQN